MKGLKYQLKNLLHDKLCILTFFLPIIVGFAINLFSEVSFSSISETAFYILQDNLSPDTIEWLQSNGSVNDFSDMNALKNAINDPATQGIGILQDENSIKTIISGDELQINKIIANILPNLYKNRNKLLLSQVSIIPQKNDSNNLKNLIIVLTMVTAMFMGCTFNAMSIIGEKEDGIALINKVLPMSKTDYVVQKITLGFMGSILSTILTSVACVHLNIQQVLPLLILIILSSFAAALVGLFIGDIANGLMIGITYIKIIMILFLAPPVIFYLAVPTDNLLYTLSYLFPSSATFYGLMDLLNGKMQQFGLNITILLIHCFLLLLLFLFVEQKNKKSFPQ